MEYCTYRIISPGTHTLILLVTGTFHSDLAKLEFTSWMDWGTVTLTSAHYTHSTFLTNAKMMEKKRATIDANWHCTLYAAVTPSVAWQSSQSVLQCCNPKTPLVLLFMTDLTSLSQHNNALPCTTSRVRFDKSVDAIQSYTRVGSNSQLIHSILSSTVIYTHVVKEDWLCYDCYSLNYFSPSLLEHFGVKKKIINIAPTTPVGLSAVFMVPAPPWTLRSLTAYDQEEKVTVSRVVQHVHRQYILWVIQL